MKILLTFSIGIVGTNKTYPLYHSNVDYFWIKLALLVLLYDTNYAVHIFRYSSVAMFLKYLLQILFYYYRLFCFMLSVMQFVVIV